MCMYTRFEYATCLHIRKVERVEQCAFPTSVDCMVQTEETEPIKITEPQYCPDCFRAYEDIICKKYDESVGSLEAKVSQIKGELSGGVSSHRQALLEKHQLWALNDIDRVKAMRRKAIKEFRDEQGVWADG